MEDNPFKVLNENVSNIAETLPEEHTGDLKTRIESVISADKIVLLMKGNADFPQCGFSANTVAILKNLGVSFKTFDILKDMDIRQGVKEYSNWPTFPQLYFNNKLLGGNDIITEMFQTGDLKEVLNG